MWSNFIFLSLFQVRHFFVLIVFPDFNQNVSIFIDRFQYFMCWVMPLQIVTYDEEGPFLFQD